MNPNDFGKNITVEDCSRFSMSTYLKSFPTNVVENVLGSILEVLRTRVTLTTTPARFGGVRFWFLCPQCEKRIGVLLVHPLTDKVGCRKCLGVEYRAKRFKGMVENGYA
jgi:PleD family two-component response regulator